jgi:hypothetical protein
MAARQPPNSVSLEPTQQRLSAIIPAGSRPRLAVVQWIERVPPKGRSGAVNIQCFSLVTSKTSIQVNFQWWSWIVSHHHTPSANPLSAIRTKF